MRERGFTLIEVLLVVAILGFLVAILLPSVAGVGADSKDRAVRANLRQLKSALEVYGISFGSYPPVANWGTVDCELLTAQGQAGYKRLMDQFPEDLYETAGFGNADTYDYALNGNTYIITSDKSATAVPTAGSDSAVTNSAELYVTNARVVTTN